MIYLIKVKLPEADFGILLNSEQQAKIEKTSEVYYICDKEKRDEVRYKKLNKIHYDSKMNKKRRN